MYETVTYLVVALCLLCVVGLIWLISSGAVFEQGIRYFLSRDHSRKGKAIIKYFTKSDEKLEKILKEVSDIARSRGFCDIYCSIRSISPLILPDFEGVILGDSQAGVILISKYLTRKFNDNSMRILIAHEVGHHIDSRTRRCGHPVFDRVKHLDREEFAFFISAYLYSKEMLAEYFDRCSSKNEGIWEKLSKIDMTRVYTPSEIAAYNKSRKFADPA